MWHKMLKSKMRFSTMNGTGPTSQLPGNALEITCMSLKEFRFTIKPQNCRDVFRATDMNLDTFHCSSSICVCVHRMEA
jgi:hypothetical protein